VNTATTAIAFKPRHFIAQAADHGVFATGGIEGLANSNGASIVGPIGYTACCAPLQRNVIKPPPTAERVH
jgi:hypothetical protein